MRALAIAILLFACAKSFASGNDLTPNRPSTTACGSFFIITKTETGERTYRTVLIETPNPMLPSEVNTYDVAVSSEKNEANSARLKILSKMRSSSRYCVSGQVTTVNSNGRNYMFIDRADRLTAVTP